MADVLSKVRNDLEKRLRELEPLIEEHAHLRQALDALKDGGTRIQQRIAATAATHHQAAENGSAAAPSPRGTGHRAEQALKLIHRHPGITLQELAKRMKIKANYLYRVLPQLERDGKVTKRDKGYHPPEG